MGYFICKLKNWVKVNVSLFSQWGWQSLQIAEVEPRSSCCLTSALCSPTVTVLGGDENRVRDSGQEEHAFYKPAQIVSIHFEFRNRTDPHMEGIPLYIRGQGREEGGCRQRS